MKFSVVSIFVAFAATAYAIPTGMKFYGRDGCNAASCAVSIAPTAVGCVSAAIQAGVDPISDAGCLAGSANLLVNTPASCSGCEAALAATGVGKKVSGAVSSAENAVSGAASSAVHAIEGLF